MNRVKSIATTSFLAIGTAISADVSTAASLQEATIFVNGAELVHTATFDLSKAENEIRVEGISPYADRNSLQVSLTGNALITAFDYSVDYLQDNQSDKKTQELIQSITKCRSDLSAVKAEIELIDRQQELLQKGIDHSMSVERQNITTEAIERNLTYYQNKSRLLDEQKQKAHDKQTELDKQLKQLNEQLKQDGTKNGKRTGVLTMTVSTQKVGRVQAVIKYFTSQAGWAPSYDLNLTQTDQPILLTLKANVYQRSGIDWKHVHLKLSTGMPSRSNAMPSVQPWRIYLQPKMEVPVPHRNMKLARDMRPLAAVEADMHEDMLEVSEANSDIMEQHVSTLEQTLTREYDIDLAYDISTNGKSKQIELTRTQIQNARYAYYCAPKYDTQVFLTAALPDWNQYNLLNGVANITYNGTYYGQTEINTASTDDELKLALGAEQQIAVKRELLDEHTARKTIGSTRSITQAYRISIRNNKKQAATLRLQESYPVSTDKQIGVSLDDKTTAWTEHDTDRGILTYELDLQPGEQREITVAFTIKYPKDRNINL
ncbi:MAG: DUF4139 domain-containing protein [Paludibacteraceae bacterium]|nr:DUF4139 domain-containing protein [Paludibacteraceae bacterium]